VSEPVLRHAETTAEIAKCYAVMRELRPHLRSEAEFIERVQRQQSVGYRLLTAGIDDRIVGLAGYRPQENLIYGHFVYVDDLVVDPNERRGGVGARLLDGVAGECRRQGVPTLVLDTAIDNSLGQRFYFRYGMLARGLRFSMPVKP
jgi:ribosomal protein S18 acetylase RimI-like enzyme